MRDARGAGPAVSRRRLVFAASYTLGCGSTADLQETSMTSRDAPRGMRVFLVLWLGQLISAIGTGLGSFTLGVWVYEKTGSATSFALMAFTAGLTVLVLSPVASVAATLPDLSDNAGTAKIPG
jgi:hypothetical protein